MTTYQNATAAIQLYSEASYAPILKLLASGVPKIIYQLLNLPISEQWISRIEVSDMEEWAHNCEVLIVIAINLETPIELGQNLGISLSDLIAELLVEHDFRNLDYALRINFVAGDINANTKLEHFVSVASRNT